MNGASWTTVTSPFVYTTKADGEYTLRITELDDAGNNDKDPRLYTSRKILVTPVIPPNKSTRKFIFLPYEIDFSWRDYSKLPDTYTVYLKKERDLKYIRIATSIPATELLDYPVGVPADYLWYYRATNAAGSWTSPVYSFSTSKFKF